MLLSEIALFLEQKQPSIDLEISCLLTDSRLLAFPSETIFFALVTPRKDAHQYVVDLYGRGVRVFVISTFLPEFNALSDAVFIQVSNTLVALQKLAEQHRKRFDYPVIGITGSNGKTVVKEWLFQLLHHDFNIVRSPRSYNSQIGVPLSVWHLHPKANLAIFEAGISQPLEMQWLQPMIQPNIGIFTNIGDAHQELFVDMQSKIHEKAILFKNAKQLIYRTDNDLLASELKKANQSTELIGWGSTDDARLRVTQIEKNGQSTMVQFVANQQLCTVCIPFTDNASVENAMHCVAVMWLLGYDIPEMNTRLQKLEPVAMRLEVKDGKQGCLIINDSYNSDLNALGIALDFLRQQADSRHLPSTLILSDILQSGYPSSQLYEEVAKMVHARHVHCLIAVGEEICKYASNFELPEKHFFSTTEALLNASILPELTQRVILLKGSRLFRFEQVLSRLELITHETQMDVNLSALVDNLNYFRSKLTSETKVMCMVKAFAYGCGAVEIARTLQHHGCEFVAVAVADEGAELRQAGIRIPIVVMNPEKSAFRVLFENNLEPEIYSFKLLYDFVQEAKLQGVTAYPIHIKIDTGMHRLGFEPEDISKLIQYVSSCQEVKVRSVFSHLAAAENPQHDAFTHQQAQVFSVAVQQFKSAFNHRILFHLLNSAGTERFPEYQYSMVRIGIGLYGVSAIPNQDLKQVCSLYTIVLQLKKLKSGETVGYNRNGKVNRDTTIAVLPVGYADGFDRKMGNGIGEVVIRGNRAKVIGNISMDLTTVDVTDLEVEENDRVEIFGQYINISELAEKTDTIPYEILTGISRRVKRVYIQE